MIYMKFQYKKDPIIVSRDGGYPLGELITPDNRKKSRIIVKNPNYVGNKIVLKELNVKRGIIVNPDAMAYAMSEDIN